MIHPSTREPNNRWSAPSNRWRGGREREREKDERKDTNVKKTKGEEKGRKTKSHSISSSKAKNVMQQVSSEIQHPLLPQRTPPPPFPPPPRLHESHAPRWYILTCSCSLNNSMMGIVSEKKDRMRRFGEGTRVGGEEREREREREREGEKRSRSLKLEGRNTGRKKIKKKEEN
jgi:hypothetical protein